MMCHIASSLSKIVLLGMFLSASAFADEILADWKLTQKSSEQILFINKDQTARFAYAAVPVAGTATAKSYAKQLMTMYHGANLRPVPSIRSWEFSYVTDLPCAMLVSRNSRFEIITLCGKVSTSEVLELIKVSRSQFKE